MRVLITGGCGFIGSHIAQFHLNKGDQVQVVDNLSTGKIQNINAFREHKNFKFSEADLLNWQDLDAAVASSDRIYHMAAVVGVYRVLKDPLKVINTNIAGCTRLFSAIAVSHTKPRVFVASTSSVYGHSNNKVLNEKDDLIIKTVNNPLRNYALSKMVDEALAMAYFHNGDIPVTIVRLFNTIGPNQTGNYGMVVPRFIQQACTNAPITIYGDGKQQRSFCDVRDVVKALDLLAENKESIGEIVNVGNDHEITINELASIIKTRANSNSDIQYIPLNKAYGEEFTDIQHRRPDLTRLFQLTGFKHKWTLENTIDDLIKRFQDSN